MNNYLQSWKRFPILMIAVCVVSSFTGTGTAPLAHSFAQKEKNSKVAVTASVLVPDKGKYRITLDGQTVGSEEFEISLSGQTWIARGSTTAHAPGGGDVKAAGQLKLAADGTPIHYEWTAQSIKKASGAVEFANGSAKSAIDLGAKTPFLQDFTFASPRIAVLDNNLYHQYAILAQLYDWKSGGKQVFPVLIPQDSTPGSISVESMGQQPVAGVNYEALRVSSTDLEILLYLDAGRRLMRVEVPSSKAIIEREK